jgi:hypothetical protein
VQLGRGGGDELAADAGSPAGAGYAREWALFCDYTAATGQPTLPTTVAAVAGFLAQIPARASTRGRRVAAIAAAHRDAGYLLARPTADPTGDPAPATLDADPEPGELLAACPTRGWPEGFRGRRDGFLIVLTAVLGLSHIQARQVVPTELRVDHHQRWRIGQRPVPRDADPRRCPTCALVRWLDILGIAEGLGRGSAHMHLAQARHPTAQTPHQHAPAEPHRWRAVAQLLPAIDRHGWIDDFRPLSTRAIHTRLSRATHRATHQATARAHSDTPATAPTGHDGRVRHDREHTTRRSDPQVDQLAGVLAQLDQVADDADALNARIQALLGVT